MPLAYSYIRFSTPDQLAGDSLRRQTDATSDYCSRKGLQLAEENYADLGVSGFSGKNLQEGYGLNAFLEAVKSGAIPSGSYLLIEALDRLTRLNPLDALDLLRRILESGVNVVTLQDEREYTHSSLMGDMSQLMMSLMSLFVGHEESKRKSLRLSQVWDQKRKNADTKIALPFWLTRGENGQLVEIAKEAKVVRLIFALAVDEGLGARAIARHLNDHRYLPPRGTRWQHSSVARILQNQSVIGVYQPHQGSRGVNRKPIGQPIKDFYPMVVDELSFIKANRTRRSSGPKPAATGPRNLFSSLAYCSCGSSLHFKRLSIRDKEDRLVCAVRCGEPSLKYGITEALFINGFSELLDQIHNRSSDNSKDIAEIELAIESKRKAITNIVAAIEQGLEIPDLIQRAKALQVEEQELQATIDEMRVSQSTFSGSKNPIVDFWMEANNPIYRRRLSAELTRWVERIDLCNKETPRSFAVHLKPAIRSRLYEDASGREAQHDGVVKVAVEF
ncbi:recombinase family protein [Fulvimarina sp. 2208YS6-2-32]|uniref:Recombinase family protein n=1 Tax=Fulvimarina uroteuthidis TaxID=3098149 RepID=A0ABU5HYJ2_9HYPH|nr:recombinase family protein [Fulvimarina sp. 2208YS6-2-32]MDY8108041.1 recombinase family protein [Fulvimarina sp. 2208YS6-2-32]